jgi:pimeloyl-ACP methyl ester carboxylesterase
MQRTTFQVDNGDGWMLEVIRFSPDVGEPTGKRPVLMVPGYAMNSFILSFHPSGLSMVEYLVNDGLEVWTADLRGQGGSTATGKPGRFGLRELSLVDVPTAIEHVLANTTTGADRLDLIGCSLGASMVYTYLAHHAKDHLAGRVIAIGGPLRWVDVHPLLSVAFRSGRVAGAVPIKGTRRLARVALPLLKRVPALLSIYLNADGVDLSRGDQLVQTIDDPVPYINRQIARWIRQKDLVVGGVNVTEGLAEVTTPLMVVLANKDGIVPVKTAMSAVDAMGGNESTVLEVGDPERWMAHADLFIGEGAQERVFEPMSRWLREA